MERGVYVLGRLRNGRSALPANRALRSARFRRRSSVVVLAAIRRMGLASRIERALRLPGAAGQPIWFGRLSNRCWIAGPKRAPCGPSGTRTGPAVSRWPSRPATDSARPPPAPDHRDRIDDGRRLAGIPAIQGPRSVRTVRRRAVSRPVRPRHRVDLARRPARHHQPADPDRTAVPAPHVRAVADGRCSKARSPITTLLKTDHYLIFYKSSLAFAQDSGRLLEDLYRGMIDDVSSQRDPGPRVGIPPGRGDLCHRERLPRRQAGRPSGPGVLRISSPIGSSSTRNPTGTSSSPRWRRS